MMNTAMIDTKQLIMEARRRVTDAVRIFGETSGNERVWRSQFYCMPMLGSRIIIIVYKRWLQYWRKDNARIFWIPGGLSELTQS